MGSIISNFINNNTPQHNHDDILDNSEKYQTDSMDSIIELEKCEINSTNNIIDRGKLYMILYTINNDKQKKINRSDDSLTVFIRDMKSSDLSINIANMCYDIFCNESFEVTHIKPQYKKLDNIIAVLKIIRDITSDDVFNGYVSSNKFMTPLGLNRMTPLLLAGYFNVDKSIIDTLILYGANTKAKDVLGRTYLQLNNSIKSTSKYNIQKHPSNFNNDDDDDDNNTWTHRSYATI